MEPGRLKIWNERSEQWEYIVGGSGTSGGGGDVTGPDNSPEFGVALFSDTTGKNLVGLSDIRFYDGNLILGNAIEADDGIFSGYISASLLTDARIDPRVSTSASSSSLTPTIASFDQYMYTALAANLTINAPTGTPVNGNKLLFAIKDNGTSRTLTWNAAFAPAGIDMPTSTTPNKWHYIGFIYNATAAKWHCIAATEEA